jgi:signal transduction histidine kinase
MESINDIRTGSVSYDRLVRGVIYLLAAVSAIRGIVVYPEHWQMLVLVLVPFAMIITCERKMHSQSDAVVLLYLSTQVASVVVLYFITPYADYWALLLLPACYFTMQKFAQAQGYAIISLFTLVMIVALWFAEGGLISLQFSAIYVVAYFMVAAYSWTLKQLLLAKNKANDFHRELEKSNLKLREYADKAAGVAILEERTAVARELHDSVTQTLFSVNLLLSSLEYKYPEQSEAQKLDIEKILSQSGFAMKELRAIIHQLKPTTPVLRDFNSEIRKLISELNETYELNVNVSYDDQPVPRLVLVSALSVIREALLNSAKHAREKQAKVSVQTIEGTGSRYVLITVTDTGPGFDQSIEIEGGHMGLEGMRLNALEVGGELTITSALNQPTVVTLKIPVIEQNREHAL